MYLLDTNVVSALRVRRASNENVWIWAERNQVTDQYMASVTILELEYGVLLRERRDLVQGAVFRRWLNEHVLPLFDGRILPVDTAIAKIAAGLQVPDPMSDLDALIAATALAHDYTIVTRNIRDFERTGVRTLNPWLQL